MGKLLAKDKEVTVPGEVLAEGMDYLPGTGTYRDLLDFDSAYHAMLSMKDGSSEYIARGADLTQYYTFGDYIVCKIINVTTQKLVDVTMKGPGLRKLYGGRIIRINTHKVPRVIGKKGSMVSMIKQATGSKIIVGQNGITWLQNDDPNMELLTVETIRKIAAEAHISGLTDRIKQFLEKKTGKKIQAAVSGE